MLYLFSVLIFIVAILLVLVVLVQNSKGGGLSANFTSTGQNMGVRKTADFLEKSTWFLAVALLVFSVAASASLGGDRELSTAEKQFNAADPNQVDVNNMAQPDPTNNDPTVPLGGNGK